MHNVYEDRKKTASLPGCGSEFDFEAFLKLEQKIEYKKTY